MTSMFDPQSFLDATIEAPMEKRPPLPVGDYTSVIEEVEARQWASKDGSKTGIAWDIKHKIDVPADLQASLKLAPQLTINDSIFIDLNEQGLIDITPGRNSGLRRYREATDLNKPGDRFSARLLCGRMVKVKIGHEIYQDAPVERIQGVTRA